MNKPIGYINPDFYLATITFRELYLNYKYQYPELAPDIIIVSEIAQEILNLK